MVQEVAVGPAWDGTHRLQARPFRTIAFARIHRSMAALEGIGVFDPLMMQMLNRQCEKLRAGANYQLLAKHAPYLGTRPRSFSQPTDEQNS